MLRVPVAAVRSLNGAAELSEAGHKERPAGRSWLGWFDRVTQKQRYFSSFVGSSDSPIRADKQSIWLSV